MGVAGDVTRGRDHGVLRRGRRRPNRHRADAQDQCNKQPPHRYGATFSARMATPLLDAADIVHASESVR
jgi:hypothetical protein